MCEIINESSIETNDIINILKTIFDPDINYNIYDMGLIYKVIINDFDIKILMTLTSINCPEADNLPLQLKNALENNFFNYNINVEITFEPLWTVDNMTEEIQLRLGLL